MVRAESYGRLACSATELTSWLERHEGPSSALAPSSRGRHGLEVTREPTRLLEVHEAKERHVFNA